jgi:hypothetical protein
MRSELWTALEERFNADGPLVAVARKLYQGFEGLRIKSVIPCVVVDSDGSEVVPAFGADIERVSLTFTLFSKQRQVNTMHDMVRNLERVFSRSTLPSAEFSTVGMERGAINGPSLVEGQYQTEVPFDLTVQWTVREPAVT